MQMLFFLIGHFWSICKQPINYFHTYLYFVSLSHSLLDQLDTLGGKSVVFCRHTHFFTNFFCRSPNWNSKNVAYEGLDGDKNLYVTFLAASEFIQSAIEKVSGKKCFAFFYVSLEKDFGG